MGVLMELIMEGRSLLYNIYMMLAQGYVILSTTAAICFIGNLLPLYQPPTFDTVQILWMIFIILPLLTIPQIFSEIKSDMMKTMIAPKNVIKEKSYEFFIRILGYRVLLISGGCLWMYVRLYIFMIYLILEKDVQTPKNSLIWWKICTSDYYNNDDYSTTLSRSRYFEVVCVSRDLMLSFLVFVLLVQSVGLLYRTETIIESNPLRNIVWCLSVLLILVLQLLYLSFHKVFDGDPLDIKNVPWDIWAWFISFPIIVLLFGEYLKLKDKKIFYRNMRFMRLEFNTRLGTYSPVI